MNKFEVVTASETAEVVKVDAFEADIVDGSLAFSGVNQGGYVAAFAPGEWVNFKALPR